MVRIATGSSDFQPLLPLIAADVSLFSESLCFVRKSHPSGACHCVSAICRTVPSVEESDEIYLTHHFWRGTARHIRADSRQDRSTSVHAGWNYGSVKAMSPHELHDIGAQIVLGNTFHFGGCAPV